MVGTVSHYKSNLRDIEFNLFELFNVQEYLGTGIYEEMDADTAREILSEVERIAREDLAASYVDSDRNPPVFDPATNTAPLPASFKKSYEKWMESGFWSLGLPEEIGGTTAPVCGSRYGSARTRNQRYSPDALRIRCSTLKTCPPCCARPHAAIVMASSPRPDASSARASAAVKCHRPPGGAVPPAAAAWRRWPRRSPG